MHDELKGNKARSVREKRIWDFRVVNEILFPETLALRYRKGDDPRTDHDELASQRDRFLTAKQGRLLHQRLYSRRPDAVGWGTPSWAGPLTTSLRGLWVSGNLSRAMADRAQGRRPENRPMTQGADS